MELVKVQNAQATRNPEALALVYDKDRKWLVQQQPNDATKDDDGHRHQGLFSRPSTRPRLVAGRRRVR